MIDGGTECHLRIYDEWQLIEKNLQILNEQKLNHCFRVYQYLRETPLSIEPGLLYNMLRLLRFSQWLTHTTISCHVQEPHSSDDIVKEWGWDQALLRVNITCELGGLGGSDIDMSRLMFTGLVYAVQRTINKMEPAGVDRVEKRIVYEKPFYCWGGLKCMQWCNVIFNKNFSPVMSDGEELFSILLSHVCSFVRERCNERIVK